MKAVMLAAGIGARLEKGPDFPPKVLMQFGGKSLLQRHIDILGFLGVRELVLGVGYRAEMIEAEIDALGARGFVRSKEERRVGKECVRPCGSRGARDYSKKKTT